VSATDDRVLEELIERLRTRFYGKYRGIVTEVDAETMRVKAFVPTVLGEVETGWCMPCVPYAGPNVGFAFLPPVESGVWIEFEGGDVSFPVWVGGYWREGEVPSEAGEETRVIVTASPLELKLDDEQGSIALSDANGNTLTLDASGITLSNSASSILVSSASVSLNEGSLEVQ
jgi:phage baseplate assembly protein gpV